MDPTLKTVLFVFLFYSLLCLIPLWESFKSKSRTELMVNGFFLIFLASFVLTGIALVSGLADSFAGKEPLKPKEAEDLANFMQYIIFGGSVVTFLFGSVGANVFCAGLLQNGNQEILRRLDIIDKKIDELEPSKNTNSNLPLKFWAIRVGMMIIALFLLWWASS